MLKKDFLKKALCRMAKTQKIPAFKKADAKLLKN